MGYIEFREVSKFYTTGDTRIAAAEKLTFTIEKSEFCVIVGPSGGRQLREWVRCSGDLVGVCATCEVSL